VQVNASVYSDPAGNIGAASNTLNFSGDTLAPTVSVSANSTTLLAGQTAAVTFTFSEAIASFALADTSVTGGTLGNLVHVGINGFQQDIYTATFTPDAANAEAATVQVNASAYSDAAGNAGAASNTLNFSGDTLAPTVSVAANSTTLLAGQTAAVTFTFSEAIASFALADTSVTGGALGNLVHVGVNGSNQDIYTATFTPDPSKTEVGSVQVNISSYADLAGNAGSASNTLGLSIDTLAPSAPTVALTHDTGISGSDHITSNAAIIYTAAEPGGILLYEADGATSFSTTVPTFTGDGLHTVLVEQQDAAGNIGAAASFSFTLDTLSPTASIAADHTALLAGDAAVVTFTFSEAIQPFTLADTSVTGGTLSDLVHAGLSAGHDVYTAVFTPDASNTETGSVQVVASSYSDIAGNTGSASNIVNFSGDTLAPGPPTVALLHDTGVSNTDKITSDPTITYTPSDSADTLFYKLDAASGFSTTAPTFATDGSADGFHTVSVEEKSADGNTSAATNFRFMLDTTAPHVTGITASPDSGGVFAGSTVELTLGFNEAVDVTGGTPTLSLNEGGTALYDAAATALLGDASKLVFDFLVSANDPLTRALAVTGFVSHGATVADLAGNPADLTHVAAAFSALSINETIVPAYTINGFTRPELELNSAGQIILDPAAEAAVAAYGTKFLYAGLPASTPVPPVADIYHHFDLV
jgi:hypothetical protein